MPDSRANVAQLTPAEIAARRELAERQGQPQRLMSIDAFRGLVMLAMASDGFDLHVLADKHPYNGFFQFLKFHTGHVEWVGCSAWDMIQPSFMFLVGVSMAFSYAARQGRGDSWRMMFGHAVWRALVLTLLGVFLRSNGRSETNWMFTDVLSQIGLGYVFLFLLWGRSTAAQLLSAFLILIAYWAYFAFWPLPEADFNYAAMGVDPNWSGQLSGFAAHWNKNTNVAHYVDLWFMNLFPRKQPFFYEGGGYQTLNFVPSLATMIFGLLAGEVLRSPRENSRKLLLLICGGIAGIVVGDLLNRFGVCPLVKRIWTPSWTLYSTGIALLLLAAFYAVIDCWRFKWWVWPLAIVGANSIAVYLMHKLTQGWVRGTLQTHLGRDIFKIFGDDYAPIAQRVAFVLVIWLACLWMYRRKIFLRI